MNHFPKYSFDILNKNHFYLYLHFLYVDKYPYSVHYCEWLYKHFDITYPRLTQLQKIKKQD